MGSVCFNGDCVELMRDLPASSFDAVVTDPPYGLEFMGEKWDRLAGTPGYNERGRITDRPDADVPYGRGGGVNSYQAGEPMEDFHRAWATEALRILKPGAYLLAFGGARTYHRLAAGVEDAGFEIRDQIMWLYATGFPKSKSLGDGMGTALKPAHEPIVVARKPPEGSVTANYAKWGTGGLNIAGSLIPFFSEADLLEALTKNPGKDGETVTSDVYGADRPQQSVNTAGRWPANLTMDEAAGALLDQLSGIRPGGGYPERRGENAVFNPSSGGSDGPRSMGDTGGASRFFFSGKANRLEKEIGLDENPHPTVKPIELMRWLLGLVTPPGGRVIDPFVGSGTTGCAAALDGVDFVGIEKDERFFNVAQRRIEAWAQYEGREVKAVMESAAAERLVKAAGQVGLFD